MTKDVRDALLVAGFFIGYALVLALRELPPPVLPSLDLHKLEFGRSIRDRLIAEELGADPVEATDAD
jgi:hypothetical protein